MLLRLKCDRELIKSPLPLIPTDDFRKKAAVTTTETKYSDLLRDLAVIKLKLETMGYGPVYIEGPYNNGPMAKSIKGTIHIHPNTLISDMTITHNLLHFINRVFPCPSTDSESNALPPTPPAVGASPAEDTSSFNEVEVLKLIPVIIEQKRKGNVSPEEEETLKDIFGDLWIVIEEEVNRADDEEMNPILKALLQSDNRLKRALVQPRQQYEGRLEVEEKNDVFGNSVDLVRVTKWPKSFVEANAAALSPQQRLMRHAALMIRQWFDENSTKPSARGRMGQLRRNRQMKKRNNKNGGGNKRPAARRLANRKKNQKNAKNGRVGGRRNKLNFRPKRYTNTEIYVDDNHGYFEYEDFEDFAYDDSMTKPRSMRSSARQLFNEYDSAEEEGEDEDALNDDYEE